jgi:DNA-binding response OmpR family regulator
VRPLVVLAEDNRELRALLAAALERVGYRIIQAVTGEPLLAELRGLRDRGEVIRAIVTDVRMPALGGLDVARSIRADAASTPLILLTAYGDAWTRTQAAQLGAVLVDKPFAVENLRRVVRTAIGE